MRAVDLVDWPGEVSCGFEAPRPAEDPCDAISCGLGGCSPQALTPRRISRRSLGTQRPIAHCASMLAAARVARCADQRTAPRVARDRARWLTEQPRRPTEARRDPSALGWNCVVQVENDVVVVPV